MSDDKKPINNESNEPPMDDSGINNDHILDLCDFIIKTSWMKYVGEDHRISPDQVTSQELKDLAFTLGSVWGLAQDILEIDRRLRGIEGNGPDENGHGQSFDIDDGEFG